MDRYVGSQLESLDLKGVDRLPLRYSVKGLSPERVRVALFHRHTGPQPSTSCHLLLLETVVPWSRGRTRWSERYCERCL